jgi:hypothetical protein
MTEEFKGMTVDENIQVTIATDASHLLYANTAIAALYINAQLVDKSPLHMLSLQNDNFEEKKCAIEKKM